MRSNLNRVYELPTSLDQRIEIAEREIERQETTLATLASDGHETTDASRHLVDLLRALTGLIRMKTEAK